MANENRLVDLNSVIERLENEWGYEGIREDLYKLPTVDAVVLPCKLGGSVYIIVKLKSGKPSHIVERKCTGIHITEKVFGKRAEKASRYLVTNSDIGFAQHIPFTEFGKTVFFDRKAAEAALAKMDGGNEDGNG